MVGAGGGGRSPGFFLAPGVNPGGETEVQDHAHTYIHTHTGAQAGPSRTPGSPGRTHAERVGGRGRGRNSWHLPSLKRAPTAPSPSPRRGGAGHAGIGEAPAHVAARAPTPAATAGPGPGPGLAAPRAGFSVSRRVGSGRIHPPLHRGLLGEGGIWASQSSRDPLCPCIGGSFKEAWDPLGRRVWWVQAPGIQQGEGIGWVPLAFGISGIHCSLGCFGIHAPSRRFWICWGSAMTQRAGVGGIHGALEGFCWGIQGLGRHRR